MQNLSYENEFDLHEKEPVSESYFHENGFAHRLVLTQRAKDSEIAYWPLLTTTFNTGIVYQVHGLMA